MSKEKGLLDDANKAISSITRPPRARYNIKNLSDIKIFGTDVIINRFPVSFVNSKGVSIVGSFYPATNYPSPDGNSCVVYLHGNVGSQIEGRFLVQYLATRGVSVYCFDFSGSGLSGGEFVTLGFNEKMDVLDAMTFLYKSFSISKVVVWGRSMGAATAILAAPLLNNCVGIVADSPYCSISELFSNVAEKAQIPGAVQPIASWWVKKQVSKAIGEDISSISPEDVAASLSIPIIIGHAAEDSFIPYHHAKRIYEKYNSEDKQIIALPGDHNSSREKEFLYHCFEFVFRVFQLDQSISLENIESSKNSIHFKTFEQMVSSS